MFKRIQGLQSLLILWVATVFLYETFCSQVISPPRDGHDNNFASQQFFFTFFHCSRFSEEAFAFLFLIQFQYELASRCSSFIDILSQFIKYLLIISIPIWFTTIFIYQSQHQNEFNLMKGIFLYSAFTKCDDIPFDIIQIQSQQIFGIFFVCVINYIALKLKTNIEGFALLKFKFSILIRFIVCVVIVTLNNVNQYDQHIIYFPILYTYLYSFSIYVSTKFWSFKINENTIFNLKLDKKQNKLESLFLKIFNKYPIIGDIFILIIIFFCTGYFIEFVQINENQLTHGKFTSIMTLSFGRIVWLILFYLSLFPVILNKAVIINKLVENDVFISLGAQTNEILLSTIIVLQRTLQFTKGMQVGPYNNATVLLTISGLLFAILCISQIIYQLFSYITQTVTNLLDKYQEQQKTIRVATLIRQKMIAK